MQPSPSMPLYEVLARAFSLAELQELCAELGVDPEVIPGLHDGKNVYARQLLVYLHNRSSLTLLIPICNERRPHIEWSSLVAEYLTNISSNSPPESLNSPLLNEKIRRRKIWLALILDIVAFIPWLVVQRIFNSIIVRLKHDYPTVSDWDLQVTYWVLSIAMLGVVLSFLVKDIAVLVLRNWRDFLVEYKKA